MNGEKSTPAKQQAPLATDTSNEFVYNVCDNQGKLLLSINAHGDVVVNELIARKIHNGDLADLLYALDRLSIQLADIGHQAEANRLVALDYTTKILEALVVKGTYTDFSIKTGYNDSSIQSVVNLDLCAQDSTARFCMYTTPQNSTVTYQYVAYYDYHHQLCVAMRSKAGGTWSAFCTVKLDSFVGHDGHNYIHMIVDDDGHLHLCANMHSDPLNYWCFTHPYSLEHYVKGPMTGMNEDSVTYPFFARLHDGRIIFTYRNGVAGNGNQYVNYLENGKWTTNRLIFDGKSSDLSVYCCGMIGDFNGSAYNSNTGYFHLFFAWRLNGDPMTTGKLCYVRTQDFQNFCTYSGTSVALPITPNTSGTVLDNIIYGDGLVNSAWRILQTSSNSTLFCYHKYYNNKSCISAILINGNSKTSVPVVTWERKLALNDILSAYLISMEEESDAFVVRCANGYDLAMRYRLNKTTLGDIVKQSGGDIFYDYPACIRQSLDNEDGSVDFAVVHDLNNSKYMAKYEYSKEGEHALPTYLKIIELN